MSGLPTVWLHLLREGDEVGEGEELGHYDGLPPMYGQEFEWVEDFPTGKSRRLKVAAVRVEMTVRRMHFTGSSPVVQVFDVSVKEVRS